eukprot:COSAG01_NODE_608_length_14865_cov_5.517879_9_plen_139_part_00
MNAEPSPLAKRLKKNLLAYWNFEEGSGKKTRDITGHKHGGTLHGNAHFTADSDKAGGKYAMRFDGSGDYVQALETHFPMGSRPRTMMAWVRKNSQDCHFLMYGTQSRLAGFSLAECEYHTHARTQRKLAARCLTRPPQ